MREISHLPIGQAAAAVLPVAPAEAAPLAGSYAFPNGDVIAISLEKAALTLTARGPKATNQWRLLSQGRGTY